MSTMTDEKSIRVHNRGTSGASQTMKGSESLGYRAAKDDCYVYVVYTCFGYNPRRLATAPPYDCGDPQVY
jgi:hypothetical protein